MKPVIFPFVAFLTIMSCQSNGCNTINFGDTLEFVDYDDGVNKILITYPAEDIILEYNQQDIHYLFKRYSHRYVKHITKHLNDESNIIYYKTKRVQYDVYGQYIKRLKKMPIEDRNELMIVLDSVYRDIMLEERLWHVKKINGLTGEKYIDYKWY